jgi:hypothetical protein
MVQWVGHISRAAAAECESFSFAFPGPGVLLWYYLGSCVVLLTYFFDLSSTIVLLRRFAPVENLAKCKTLWYVRQCETLPSAKL